jgi:hypothetical protein
MTESPMPAAPSLSSPAFSTAVSAYASRIIKAKSPQYIIIDPSLGPFVVSSLSSSKEKDSQTYDGQLMDLLMEQCEMMSEDAKFVLDCISKALLTGHFQEDNDDRLNPSSYDNNNDHRRRSVSFFGNNIFQAPFHEGNAKFRSKSTGHEGDLHDYHTAKMLGDLLNRTEENDRDHSCDDDKDDNGDKDNDTHKTPMKDESQTTHPNNSTNIHNNTFMLTGFSPFLSEEDKKVVQDLKNLQPPTFTFTPVKEDVLIPFDLLGVIDDVSSPPSFKTTDELKCKFADIDLDRHDTNIASTLTKTRSEKMDNSQTNTNTASSFITPSELSNAPSHTTIRKLDTIDNQGESSDPQSKLVSSKSLSLKTKKKIKTKEAEDLAATLFARPRAHSAQYDEKSPKLKPMAPPPPSQLGMSGLLCCSTDAIMKHSIPALFKKQLDSAVEILMAMNYDVCAEAAHEAALVSNADVNVAQHVIDGALAAPPVCRHLLNDGCYRSDCQFSHDVDGHTCLFWLRGRCRSGDSCKFMHGFSEKLLDGLTVDYKDSASIEHSGRYLAPTEGGSISGSGSKVKTANLVQINMNNKFTKMKSSSTPLASPMLKSKEILPGPPIIGDSDEMTIGASAVPKNTPVTTSFASIASKGYSRSSSFNTATVSVKDRISTPASNFYNNESTLLSHGDSSTTRIPNVKIPQDLWNPSHNRSANAFHITDPILRYKEVMKSQTRDDVIDLHFQSMKTFPTVLSAFLPEKLRNGEAWVITGSGHGVSSKTHQKGGGVLESAVLDWLISNEYSVSRGKDKNGFGGAFLVRSKV